MDRQRWQDWATLVLGLWIIASPLLFFVPAATSAATPATSGWAHWSLYFSSIEQWNFYIVGLALVIVGVAALYSGRLWEEWIDVVLGLWLLASPWVLRYADQSMLKWDAVIVGLVVAALAAWALASGRRQGHPA